MNRIANYRIALDRSVELLADLGMASGLEVLEQRVIGHDPPTLAALMLLVEVLGPTARRANPDDESP